MPANPFTTETAARLYSAGRPDYSGIVATVMQELTGLEEPVDLAVDIGSGTGISTLTLTRLANRVVGVEPVDAMLRRARQAANVRYVIGAAEALPIADQAVDLVGAGSVLHWLDRDRFIAETSRIAAPAAWLVVHYHWFTGQMEDGPGFREWTRHTYLARYPSPPRDQSWRPPDDIGPWRHIAAEPFDHPVPMNVTRFTEYLLTQSNLHVVMERGDRTEEELRAWVRNEIEPFFPDYTATMLFAGSVSVFQRNEAH